MFQTWRVSADREAGQVALGVERGHGAGRG
jgi:hypothetical protein